MSELTSLTLAEARDRLRRREFSAVELADAHLAAIEQARALNAYVLETPEQARAMAKAADARLASGRGRAARRHSARHQGPVRTKGVRTTACSHILDNFVPTYESTVTAQLWRDGAVMLGKLNNDEFAMGSSNETSCFGPVIIAVAARGLEHAAGAGRLVRRLGGGGGGAALPRRDRHRHRRLDPPAGGLHRHRRHQADLWPLLALGHRRLRLLARPGRAVRAHGARRRDPAALDGRARSEGHDLASTCRCRTTRRRSARSVKGMKIGIPKEYRIDGMPAEIETLWEQGAQWLKDGRRRDRRGLAAAHQIRAAGLLHRRAGRGLVQPRAL